MKEEKVNFILQSNGLNDSILQHLNIPGDPSPDFPRLPLPPSLKFAHHDIGVAWLSDALTLFNTRGSQLEQVKHHVKNELSLSQVDR